MKAHVSDEKGARSFHVGPCIDIVVLDSKSECNSYLKENVAFDSSYKKQQVFWSGKLGDVIMEDWSKKQWEQTWNAALNHCSSVVKLIRKIVK